MIRLLLGAAVLLPLLFLMLLLGCALRTAPEELYPAWLLEQWNEAQFNITRLRQPPPGSPFKVSPNGVTFDAVDGMFDCGGVITAGCTYPNGKMIRYNRLAPTVLHHEAGHLILYLMHDPRWHEFEHREWCELPPPYGWEYFCEREKR